jgi:hypothetical protein
MRDTEGRAEFQPLFEVLPEGIFERNKPVIA